MAETERAKTIRQIDERTKAIKARQEIVTAPTAGAITAPSAGATTIAPTAGATTTPTTVTPKKKKGTLRSILEKIKNLRKPKKKIDLPTMAKEDIPALRAIMGKPPLPEETKK